MVERLDTGRILTLHPLHAVLLAGTVPLFLGALLCDIAYWRSYEIQWSNFASWLIAGALVLAGVVVVLALVGLARRSAGAVLYALVVVATWILGFINALVHAKDAWAVMPEGLVLSLITFVLACLATVIGFSRGERRGGRP